MKLNILFAVISLAAVIHAAEPVISVDARHLPAKSENIVIRDGKLLFDGKTSCAELPKSASPASYTWTAWVRPEKKAGSSVIVNKQGFHTTLKYSEWKVFFFSTYTDDRKLVQIRAPKRYEPGRWYFVSCGYDAATNRIWIGIDGEIADEKVLNRPLLPNDGKYSFGCFPTSSDRGWFAGEIGGIDLYDQTIPETELEEMYRKTKDTWK